MNADLQVTGDEFEEGSRMVALRYFDREPEARVLAARLKAIGIQSYLSNTYALTALPLTGSGIGLHVKDSDLPDAMRLLIHLEKEQQEVVAGQSFHDADLEEILYQKALNQPEFRIGDKVAFTLLSCLILVLIIKSVLDGIL